MLEFQVLEGICGGQVVWPNEYMLTGIDYSCMLVFRLIIVR
jgi:hypothetical protein